MKKGSVTTKVTGLIRSELTSQLSVRLYEPAEVYVHSVGLFSTRDPGAGERRTQDFPDMRIVMQNEELLEIQFKPKHKFSLAIHNHQQWATTARVTSDEIDIDGVYKLRHEHLTVMQVSTVERQLLAQIKIVLLATGTFHRVDMKLDHSPWYALFIFGRILHTVRPNGDFYGQVMEKVCNHVSKRTLDFQRTAVDLQFLVGNQVERNALMKRIEAEEKYTQTEEQNAVPEKQAFNMEMVKEAVNDAMETWLKAQPKETPIPAVDNTRSHPWNSDQNAGAKSLLLLSDKKSNDTKTNQKQTEPSEWSYAYMSKVNQQMVDMRNQNRKMFGGLFAEDADDEEDGSDKEEDKKPN